MTEYPGARESLMNYLSFVGNHEHKLGIAAILYANPNYPYHPAGVAGTFNRLGDMDPEVSNFSRTIKSCIVPGGVATAIKDGNRNYYLTNPEDSVLLKTATGFLVDWSLKFPSHSLQQVLGATQTPGEIRSPLARYLFYGQLLTRDAPPTITQLAEVKYKELGNKKIKHADVMLNPMRKLGLIAVKHIDTHPRAAATQTPMTEVSIAPAAMEPIKSLYAGLERVLKGEDTRRFRTVVDNIARGSDPSDTTSFATLTAKGRNFSQNYNSQVKGGVAFVRAKIREIMADGGDFTATELRHKLADTYDRPLNMVRIYRILNGLANDGYLTVRWELMRPTGHNKSIQLYKLNSEGA